MKKYEYIVRKAVTVSGAEEIMNEQAAAGWRVHQVTYNQNSLWPSLTITFEKEKNEEKLEKKDE